MKLQSTLFFSLATLAAAAPVVDIRVTDVPAHNLVDGGLCWLLCADQSLQCPDGWYLQPHGNCYTCCNPGDSDDEAKSQAKELIHEVMAVDAKEIAQAHAKMTVHAKVITGYADGCIQLCMPEPLDCPDGFNQAQFGPCNTCCLARPDLAHAEGFIRETMLVDAKEMAQAHAKTTAHAMEIIGIRDGPCLKACLPQPMQCPSGWNQAQFGQCNTCCLAQQDQAHAEGSIRETMLVDAKEKAQAHAKTTAHAMEVHFSGKSVYAQAACLMICWPEQRDCPSGLYSQQFGDCWTCCIEGS